MLLRDKIASYLDDFDTSLGIGINLAIIGLIFISLVIFVTETYRITDSIQTVLNYIDLGILILFAMEYCLRFWCAKSRIKFFLSFFSLIDLISILPLFIGFIDIRFFRIFRWFRILRMIRLIQPKQSFFDLKAENSVILTRIFLTLFSLVFIYSGLIYQIEHKTNPQVFRNFFDAFYFSIVTMTTVGFGDVIPLSDGGRLLTLLMIFTGLILIPWQLGLLTRELLKITKQNNQICSSCGLAIHDSDANFCKICGVKLKDLPQHSREQGRDSTTIED